MFREDEYVNFSLVNRRPLFEADDDEAAEGGGEEAPAADAPAEDEGGGEENTEDDNTEEEGGDEEAPPEEENFDINGDGPESEEGEEGGEDEGGGGDAPPADARDEEPTLGDNTDYTNPNVEKEKEIYDDLSPEEQQMKDKAQRKNYTTLYSNIEQIINKLDSIAAESEDISPSIKRLILILYEYKQIIHDYFNNLYNSKSYIENLQNYEKYKLFLYGVKNIIATIDNSIVDDNNKDKK